MRINMCTGVFDLFHEGHKNFIRFAGGDGVFLLVGVLSDWMTGIVKGAGRPVEVELVRAEKVNGFMMKLGIWGKAFVTDKLDFREYKGLVDYFVLGEGQKIKWDGPGGYAPRTAGVSTTEMVKGMKK